MTESLKKIREAITSSSFQLKQAVGAFTDNWCLDWDDLEQAAKQCDEAITLLDTLPTFEEAEIEDIAEKYFVTRIGLVNNPMIIFKAGFRACRERLGLGDE